MIKILVLNSGSSSLKFQLFNMQGLYGQKMAGQEIEENSNSILLASGLVEQIGENNSSAHLKLVVTSRDITPPSQNRFCIDTPIADHKKAIETMEVLLKKSGCLAGVEELSAIGHRVVHGGEDFHQPTLIDNEVLKTINKLIPLAPLHNPANLIGINIIKQRAPQLPQVAVFDTAFHQSIPEHAYIYGLPYNLYEQYQIRRYGFHGTSHHYVAKQAAEYLNQSISDIKLISIHLGNGTSAAAIQYGKSIDTSMGMTPLEGLVMGTRCGDIDPAILFYLSRETGMTTQEMDDLLNKQSGLKGICGQNDMRTIIKQAEQGDKKSELAINIFCYHIKKYIGAYLAALNGADAIIFTGGIGENSALVRERACHNLQNLGITIDPKKNNRRLNNSSTHNTMEIQAEASPIKILVIPTNEELEIATQTIKLIQEQALL